MAWRRQIAFLLAVVGLINTLAAGDVKVELPEGMRPADTQPQEKGERRFVLSNGKTAVGEIRLADGVRLIPVDMTWHGGGAFGAEKPGEQDIAEIKEILTVPSFYDKLKILHIEGDKDRVTALVELLRDREFHAGGKDVIWRVELWYFEFLNGGWAKVSQQSKVLDRQRFNSPEKHKQYVEKIRWVPKLGAASETVRLSPEDLK